MTDYPKYKGGTLWNFLLKKNGFSFLGSQKIRKKSLIPMIYNTLVKSWRKKAKKLKIPHFWAKWPNLFWLFLPIFSNICSKCYTLLESVNFFWSFETLKMEIHFFSKKNSKGSPLWILGNQSPTKWLVGGFNHHFFFKKIIHNTFSWLIARFELVHSYNFWKKLIFMSPY